MIKPGLWCLPMSSTLYGDAARSNLRASVACVERALSQTPPGPALRAAWDDLVKVLALGPLPDDPPPAKETP